MKRILAALFLLALASIAEAEPNNKPIIHIGLRENYFALPQTHTFPALDTNNAFTGNDTFCILQGWYVAGSSCYATILAAENAACALTPNGSVLIPATYAGTDLFRYDIGLCTRGFPAVIDLRRNALGIATVIAPVRPSFGSGQGGANALLPLGADLVLEADGAADMHLRLPTVVTTTTATINIGANPSVLISAVTCPNCSTGLGITQTGANNFFTSASLVLGRETANEESVIAGNWSIVDATHLSITAAKSHAGTTDIEQQQGSFFFDGASYVIFSPNNPSQLAAHKTPIRFFDPQLNVIYFMPSNTADPWPYGAMNFVAPLTGAANAIPLTPANLVLRNAGVPYSVVHQTSTGTIDMTLADTGPVFNNILNVTNAFTAGTVNSTGNMFANTGTVTSLGFRPVTAGASDLGTTALPWLTLWLGTAATNNAKFQPATMSATRVVEILDSDFALGKAMVTSTYTNATTTPSNITGLSFAVLANRNYTMDCQIYYQGSAGTAGLDITVTGPAAPTSIFYSYEEDATATTTQNSVSAGFGTKLVGAAAVTATTNLPAHVTIGLRNGANAGTVQLQGSATGAGTITIQVGSACTIQ